MPAFRHEVAHEVASGWNLTLFKGVGNMPASRHEVASGLKRYLAGVLHRI